MVGEGRYEVVRGAVECVGKPRGPRDRIIGIAGRGRIGAAAAGDIGPPSLTVIGWSDERIGAVLVCRRQTAEPVIAGGKVNPVRMSEPRQVAGGVIGVWEVKRHTNMEQGRATVGE